MPNYQVATFTFDVDSVNFLPGQEVNGIELTIFSRDRFIVNWGNVLVPLELQQAFLAYMFGDRFIGVNEFSLLDVFQFLRLENEDLSLFHFRPGNTRYTAIFDFEGPIGLYISAFAFGRYPYPL